jgi:MFS family permease
MASADEMKDMVDDIGPDPAYGTGLFKGLNANVLRMGWVSFFADVSSELLYPITPLFLTLVLGAPYAAVGMIEGVAEATASLLKSVSGRWSDRTGARKPFVIGGYTLSALAKPLIGVASGWALVLLARVLDRFGKGLRSSPRDALLADSIAPEYRGRAFGWHRAMDTAGAVIGPLLALWLITVLHDNLRMVFFWAFIPGLLGALLVLLVRERRHRVEAKAVPSIAYGALPPGFRNYLWAWGIFSIANSSDVFLILRANQTLGGALPQVILLYVLYNLIYAIASPWLGHLSDTMGRRRVLIGGLLVFTLVYTGFALATQGWHIWALFAIYGLYTAATDGVGKALAVDLVPKEIRASALGLLGTVTGLAALLASTVAGSLWTLARAHQPLASQGAWAPFLYGAVGALFGAMLLLRVPERKGE